MPLIVCPDYQQQVFDAASACVNCASSDEKGGNELHRKNVEDSV